MTTTPLFLFCDAKHGRFLVTGDVYDQRVYHQLEGGRPNAVWSVEAAAGGGFYLRDQKHGKCLVAGDVYDGNVYHQDPGGRPNAIWDLDVTVDPVSGQRSLVLTDRKHRKCLLAGDVYDGNLYHQDRAGRENGRWIEQALFDPQALKEVQAEPASEAAAMARDFLKTGGRRIGWSAQKKMFAYPAELRSETGFGLDIQFVGEDGKPRDAMRICQIGECEEHLDELSKELLPKLTSRLENDGYVSVRGIGWPQGRDELEVSSLSMKLQYSKGTLSSLREGKPAARLSIQGGKRISADTLLAVFVIPDTKWLPVFAPPGKDAKGLTQEFFVFKLP